MSDRFYLNEEWFFSESFKEEYIHSQEFKKLDKVRIPHTVKTTPFNYFDESEYQMVSGYYRELYAPLDWAGKYVELTFEGIAHDSEVYVNGKPAGSHHCGYTAFSIDISSYLKFGDNNIIAVKDDSRENLNIPPFGLVIDYMTYGGMYRECYLEVKEQVHINDLFVSANMTDHVRMFCHLSYTDCGKTDLGMRYYIREKGGEYRLLGEKTPAVTEYEFEIENAKLWDIDTPYLYDVKVELLENGKVVDKVETVTGFRTAEFKEDGFYLNGRKVKIRGLNRHQSYPYVGYAMPASMQKLDADILKKELALNAVRTSHYPQSKYFYDRCDELGLMVFTEIPGWQHIGDKEWKAQAVKNVEDMIVQNRNHPSIILWGVRINESADDDEFYKRTNEVAHILDPTRQTGGVRAIKKSHLFEDVYTYNDFVHNGIDPGCLPKKKVTANMDKPYMVTEYNGHMYPTKTYDCEEHRQEHAIRHARVLDAVAGYEDIAGSFGWCMFDYNTHKDFGSGDRICYHGVMDMFRNPKMAACVYASQGDQSPYLEVSSTMDIGEHPATERGLTYIFTNADSVKMYKNDKFISEFTEKNRICTNLRHGPIVIDDFVGDVLETEEHFPHRQAELIKGILNDVARFGMAHPTKRVMINAAKLVLIYHMKPEQVVNLYTKHIGDWGTESIVYRFEAIKNGKPVKTLTKSAAKGGELKVRVDHTDLYEQTTYDVAEVRIKAVDENGNVLPFSFAPVRLKAEGDVELIGPSLISLQGGMAGAYVKSKGKSGFGKLIIETDAFGKDTRVTVDFEVKALD
ncbi:MAG: glycoside hydrolase family 2 protein [Acetatifactor sp.]|nr:glycoside hydrolase family 2 protein [Acetatifactor sp.]